MAQHDAEQGTIEGQQSAVEGHHEATLAEIERAPNTPMPAEQRAAVLKAIRELEGPRDTLHRFPLPEGSEPAFVFRPVSLAAAETTSGTDGGQADG